MMRFSGMTGGRVHLIITLLVLTLPASPGGAEPVSGEPKENLFNVAVRVGGSTTWLRLGDYYRGTSTAFGCDADLMVRLSRRVALKAAVGKAGFKAETDPAVISADRSTEYIYRNYDVSAWRYFLSGQYSWDWLFKRLARKGLGRTIIGVSFGVGIITHKQSVDGVMYPEGAAVSDTQTKFALTIGTSYTQMLGGRIGMYVLSETDIVFLGDPADAEVHWREDGGVATLDHLRFGLTYVLW
ncbi:MAG: hypothetical protein JSW34_00255 [Candidatus Zixiibacteriota bacterium]|nr:MAG: hypothetical protein JSW34_00255 [candidate division Zixibacteria bacterium]